MPVFAREEYLQRLQETKRRMNAEGLDALVVIDHSNIFYLTGYDGHSAYVPQALVVIAQEEEPRLILREMDVPGDTAFIQPKHIHGYPEDYIAHPRAHPYDYFGDLFRQWGIAGKRLGVELDWLTPNTHQRLQQAVPNARFVDVGNLVTWQRLKKSPAELAYMSQAGVIADLAMQAAYDNIAVGVRECDVAAEIMAAQVRGTPEFGGDRPVTPAMPTGSPRSAAPHLSWTDARYENNSVTNIELGGFRKRYVAGLSRTLVLGKPEDKLTRLHEATRDAFEAVFANVRAGWTCEEVEALYRKTTRKHGFEKKSRVGYAMGIDWTEKTASLRSGDTTVLEPDMTFHLMAGMWYDDWGYVLSEAFRVTDRNIESFSKLSRELFVK
ncbi:Xaa-Pro peptidase family protein [Aquamicrobium sp. LC103]|uniref:M24 family metallopeptidase n=1 Tax=Aquamicrobium sp. LC103 TaxID=1120658 RepID=UPI00063EC605|nr:Xaa-Pro peptidase family protein [Aquamicrobium sp. LC103]TKT74589.1 M24 family metallopeptidase [Aquamicrobium sp. LC103]